MCMDKYIASINSDHLRPRIFIIRFWEFSIEIVVEHGFYDYKSKYILSLIKEIVSTDVDNELDRELREVTFNIHQILELEIYSRTDFIDIIYNIHGIIRSSLLVSFLTTVIKKESKFIDIISLENQLD